jgi:predicted TIM-barrel fold metal-dependent hydrolase
MRPATHRSRARDGAHEGGDRAHLAASPYLRGIRSVVPRNFEGAFLDGYSILAKHHLSLDHYSPDGERLRDLARLSQAQPDVTIIVNHLGAADGDHLGLVDEVLESLVHHQEPPVEPGSDRDPDPTVE